MQYAVLVILKQMHIDIVFRDVTLSRSTDENRRFGVTCVSNFWEYTSSQMSNTKLSKNRTLKPLSNFYTFVTSFYTNSHYQNFVHFKIKVYFNLLATDFFQILAHPVFKM